MRIAIDIGNTRTKLAVHDGSSIIKTMVANHGEWKEVESYLAEFHIDSGIISSVTGDCGDWQERFSAVNWMILDHQTPLPFNNLYGSPETLGIDRIALVAGAYHAFSNTNVLVLDAGTCITYDILKSNGDYLGGGISPGLEMRLKAMSAFTSKLPHVPINPAVPLVGNSTITSLQSGALNGLISEIEGIIFRYQEQFEDLHVVLSGGDTKTLAPLIKSNIFARPNFLLEGLHVILAFNTP